MSLDYLWRVFQRLARRRTSNGFGSNNPITWADIDAFVRHSKFPLKPWEVEIIEDLDDLERVEQARSQESNMSADKKTKRKSED